MKSRVNMLPKSFLIKLSHIGVILFVLLLTLNGSLLKAQTIIINKGDVTGLPIPRFVSVKSNKVNVRRGPSSSHQIDWVYTRSGVPLKVTAEYGNWRRVVDFQQQGGWIHARLLSGKRFVIFINATTVLKRKPNKKSPAVAVIEQGVIARLTNKAGSWCEVSIQGYSGWVPNISLWGVLTKNAIKTD